MLRFLLMLPGGDRVEGLKDMEAVHERGVLLRGEADYQLHWIYLWYENQPKRAYGLLRSLRERYPGNPHFVQRMADVDDRYFHDAGAAPGRLAGHGRRGGEDGRPRLADVEGRLGAAVGARRARGDRPRAHRGRARPGDAARAAVRRPRAGGVRSEGASSIGWDGATKPSPHTVPPSPRCRLRIRTMSARKRGPD